MCRHSYYYPGHRTYGDNIPGYAVGAYFPGDEPGTRCLLTGEACGNPCGETPTECAVNNPTEWLCPECQKECFDSALWKSGEGGTFFCRECEGEWTEAELPRVYTELLVFLVREKGAAEDACRNAREEKDVLQATLDRVLEAIGVAV